MSVHPPPEPPPTAITVVTVGAGGAELLAGFSAPGITPAEDDMEEAIAAGPVPFCAVTVTVTVTGAELIEPGPGTSCDVTEESGVAAGLNLLFAPQPGFGPKFEPGR